MDLFFSYPGFALAFLKTALQYKYSKVFPFLKINTSIFDIKRDCWQKREKKKKKDFLHGNGGWQFPWHSNLSYFFLQACKWRGQERVCLFRSSSFDQSHSLWRMEYWIPFAVRLCLSAFESGCSLWTLWNMSIPPASPLPFFPDIGIFEGHRTAWPEKQGVLKHPWTFITHTSLCRESWWKYCSSRFGGLYCHPKLVGRRCRRGKVDVWLRFEFKNNLCH